MDDPMTAPESPASSGSPRPSQEPVSTLRGASVNYDARRVGRIVVGVCLAALLVLVVIFTIAGINKNSQVNRLHQDGVPVTVTITSCLGLMGGSGSNAAGYSCTGAFIIDGKRYSESLPGTDYHKPNSSLRAIVVPNDPALVTPVSIDKTEHSGLSVFILPGVLLVVLLLLVGLLVVLQRRTRHGVPPSAPDVA
jgi:hypothetical protein